ncbi:MAG: MBL fold metallo-hydrolase [Hellea sp.]|nr:MBL fold metallo-hydrolase [Hellea sp.]
MPNPIVNSFFDPETSTVSYVVSDPETRRAAIIDSVLNYDAAAGRTSTSSADEIIDHVRENELAIDWILETHAHADHLSAATYLRAQLGGKIAIGEHIPDIQNVFSKLFNFDGSLKRDGSQFDHLFADGDEFKIGTLEGTIIFTPGHTPACISYHIGDAVFVGDTLFMPDYGTARCDFPGGDAATLYNSVQRLFALPDDTRMFLCHDYLPEGRDIYIWETIVGQQKSSNIHINEKITKAEFVAMRNARDAKLEMPRLILPSIQVNIRAGELPEPEDNGTRYLKIPLNAV